MDRIVECVPNFSEGRNSEIIAALVASVNEGTSGAAVLGVHMDANHNRSVITFAGQPEGVEAAALRVVERASELIDLRNHTGVHPRLGATDVVPFVPIAGVTMKECVAIAHRVGERVAKDLSIPVYFYEHAALLPERHHLEHVRRGGFEQLAREIGVAPESMPDVGPSFLHWSAGACIIGARHFLIAFNVNLQSSDLASARRIAKAVRARDGGLPYVKALGVELATRGIVQVSMNLIDYKVTSMLDAFVAVEREAALYGIEIEGSEIVGLVPQDALPIDAERLLKIENFSTDLILENRLRSAFNI
ncbi:MAG: glutamate formimidoyltransferase [Pyrinomonadaceae bacterium]